MVVGILQDFVAFDLCDDGGLRVVAGFWRFCIVLGCFVCL